MRMEERREFVEICPWGSLCLPYRRDRGGRTSPTLGAAAIFKQRRQSTGNDIQGTTRSPALIAQFGFVLTSPCMPAAVPPGCQYGGTAVTRGTIRAALWEAALLAAGAGRCGSAARRELPRRGSSPREFCSAVVWNGVCAVLHLLPWFLRGRRSAGTEPGSDCVNWSVVSIPL
ncbi:uncharacterized protein LOC100859691 isoform X2 [Gallus gallus]|uniref:uncharacterized protein LOC100859691 isoform X2 n=1 Tax=Gallus gallus TaxID=9031 RepID=UPI001AE7F2DF|nr:uncharacterized protein LOC100859691 isoform X2 [Gallus gallus]XP_046792931.1 uncharacterized protein LOC100859691 isoform X2 [Gallus gallus]